MEALVETLRALSQKIDDIESRNSYLVSGCDVCGIQGHTQNYCQYNIPYYPNQTQFWDENNTHDHLHQLPQYNPYADTYNSGWEDYTNFSYQENPPQPPQKSNFESLMEGVIVAQLSKNEEVEASLNELKAQGKLIENSIAQLAREVTEFVEMRTQTEEIPMNQFDDATLWSGKEFKESQNKISNGKLIFDDFDDEDGDFDSLTFIDPYVSQEINLHENSIDNNDVDFLDDSVCMLFDEGDNMVVSDVNLKKDIMIPIMVKVIEPNLDKLDLNNVKIENVYMPFVDPIWEEFVKRSYKYFGEDFAKYFHISKFLEHHMSLTCQFMYLLGYLIGAHIIRLIQIRRYVHLYAFSPG